MWGIISDNTPRNARSSGSIPLRRHSALPHCTMALNNRSSEQSNLGSFTIATTRDGDNVVNPIIPHTLVHIHHTNDGYVITMCLYHIFCILFNELQAKSTRNRSCKTYHTNDEYCNHTYFSSPSTRGAVSNNPHALSTFIPTPSSQGYQMCKIHCIDSLHALTLFHKAETFNAKHFNFILTCHC